MASDVDVIKEGMEGLIRAGYYRDREALLEELHSILRAFWESGILSKKGVRDIIKEIEEKDNTRIKDTNAIFD